MSQNGSRSLAITVARREGEKGGGEGREEGKKSEISFHRVALCVYCESGQRGEGKRINAMREA